MKNYLVIGADSLAGSIAAKTLINQGYKAKCIVNAQASPWRISEAALQTQIYKINYQSNQQIIEVIEKIKPNAILNMIDLGEEDQDLDKTKFDIHINITNLLCELIAKLNLDFFIQLGSWQEYGYYKQKFNENDRLQPITAYGLYKSISTQIILNRLASICKIYILRPFYLYGPFASTSNTLGKLLCQAAGLINQKTLELPNQNIDLISTKDFSLAISALLRQQPHNENIFNIATGQATSWTDIACKLKKSFYSQLSNITCSDKNQPSIIADPSLARSLLQWQARTMLDEGLIGTVSWLSTNKHLYPNHLKTEDPLSIRQSIASFFQKT